MNNMTKISLFFSQFPRSVLQQYNEQCVRKKLTLFFCCTNHWNFESRGQLRCMRNSSTSYLIDGNEVSFFCTKMKSLRLSLTKQSANHASFLDLCTLCWCWLFEWLFCCTLRALNLYEIEFFRSSIVRLILWCTKIKLNTFSTEEQW